jgi:hypothetical protein
MIISCGFAKKQKKQFPMKNWEIPAMTDIKKKDKGKSGVKSDKLRLNKETLKDLGASGNAQVKGGAQNTDGGQRCTQRWSNCTIG